MIVANGSLIASLAQVGIPSQSDAPFTRDRQIQDDEVSLLHARLSFVARRDPRGEADVDPAPLCVAMLARGLETGEREIFATQRH